MFDGDVSNQLKHGHGLTNACATKQTNFTTTGKGANQVDDLNARFENFVTAYLIFVSRCLAVNGHDFFRVDRTFFINGRTKHIHDSP